MDHGAHSPGPHTPCVHTYVIALGSNRRHPAHGPPRAVLVAALAALGHEGLHLLGASRPVDSRPLGPSLRTYANSAALIGSALEPEAMLARLKAIEARFGRRRGGQRWSARVLDLDIVLWNGGAWASPRLVIPHPAYRLRAFVLAPMRRLGHRHGAITRDPLTGLTPAHLHARLTRPRPLPKPRP
ncbi:2-amino-4-hydroxy-6-hydroxymethyldihydropteridine diphosphokinase [Novosphingobium bradum]|uniref:2-amino-4-hydroxy-6-hydroxymethyldihydropteridine pyrophosphokinase n=1 Tax=Novosphingobium bradum TaxID=1737444 RepID=A0ABV7IS37_9SPHN